MEIEIYGCSSQETLYDSVPSLDKSEKHEWYVWKTSLNNKKSYIGINVWIHGLSSIVVFLCREVYEDILGSYFESYN